MRTIKFRGKQLEDIKETEMRYGSKKGEWRYGSYLYAHKYRGGEHAHLICNIYGEECIMCDKETIEQFTGLYDKNGVEIWEGDIVKYTESYGCSDQEKEDCESIVEIYNTSTFPFSNVREVEDCWYSVEHSEYEVIGNIHESDKHE